MTVENQRQIRLESEYQRLLDIKSRSDLIDVEVIEGIPPKRYRITFKCKGIMLHPDSSKPCITTKHIMEVYLPAKYPAEPPYIKWMTPIFHPNFSKGGSVCIGVAGKDWAPSLNLAWIVEQIADMVTYRFFNIDDPWNKDAAEWARENIDKFPLDDRPLFRLAEPVTINTGEKTPKEQVVVLELEEEELEKKNKQAFKPRSTTAERSHKAKSRRPRSKHTEI